MGEERVQGVERIPDCDGAFVPGIEDIGDPAVDAPAFWCVECEAVGEVPQTWLATADAIWIPLACRAWLRNRLPALIQVAPTKKFAPVQIMCSCVGVIGDPRAR
jgi:hypothetical protein